MEKAGEAAARAQDLTALLAPPNPYSEEEEEGNDIHFHRWANYVEPRVAYAAGDLRVLEIGQQIIADRALGKTALRQAQGMPLGKGAATAAAGQWQPLGPYSSNTLGSGRLNWIAFHPTDSNSFMVGAPVGGLWMTRDGGTTWSTGTDRIAVLGAASAAYHSSNPNIIYLGTGDGDHKDSWSVGVLKSIDGGATWQTTGLSYAIADNMEILKIKVDPGNGERLLVATTTGLQISNDGGTTFHAAAGITWETVYDIEFNPANPSIVYASTTKFYRSVDGGETFTLVPAVPAAGFRMQLAVTSAQPDYVYALRGASAATEGVYRSLDAGLTFAQTGTGAAIGCTQAWYDYAFGANPLNANEIMAGCINAYRSTNGGSTWAGVGTGIVHPDIHATEYRRDGTAFMVTDGGIWRSAGSTAWTNLSNNLNIGQSYRIGVHRTDYDQICTGRQDDGTDVRGVQTGAFRAALGGDGMECFFNAAGTRFYGENQNGAFRRCNYANGAVSTCVNIYAGLPAGPWETVWAGDPNNSSALFTGRNGQVWRSINEGASWAQLGTLGGTGDAWNMTVAPSNSNVLYLVKGTTLFKTSNAGVNWTNVTGNIAGTPYGIAVAANDPSNVWVTVMGYVDSSKLWHSLDGGLTWNNETLSGLPNLPANSVAIDDAAGQNSVYLAMDVGVYFKQDGMPAWQDFSGGLPNTIARELQIANKGGNPADRRITLATYGRGVWQSTLWNLPTPTDKTPLPDLRDFSASVSGSTLSLRFRLGADGYDRGFSVIQLATVDGKIVFQDRVPNFGVFESRVSLAGHGRGLYLFILKNAAHRISRPIFVN